MEFRISDIEESMMTTDRPAVYPDTPFSMIVAFNIGRICALFSIPLHFLVIVTVIRYRKTDHSMKNSYFHMLANLCAIDLIRVIQLLTLKTWLYTFEGWRRSNETGLPQFDAFCQFFAYQANLFQLTAIALNRLLEMTLPLKAKTIWTSKVTKSVNIGSWLCGIAFALPLLSSTHRMEHLPLYQGIFWSNDWDNQTKADAYASKAYIDIVSKGGIVLSGLLLATYLITFSMMIKYRLNQTLYSNRANRRYKAEVDLTIQALLLTSFVFLYNIGLLLYTRECCPWFVAPNIVAMLWAAHYSGPMLALVLSTTLRRSVKRLLTVMDISFTSTEYILENKAAVYSRFRLRLMARKRKRLKLKNKSWTYKEKSRCQSDDSNKICFSTEL